MYTNNCCYDTRISFESCFSIGMVVIVLFVIKLCRIELLYLQIIELCLTSIYGNTSMLWQKVSERYEPVRKFSFTKY